MRTHGLALALVLLAGCASAPAPVVLGAYERPVTTRSVAAQAAFARGLLYCYGFNHDEAVRCFEAAAAADPRCAMAQWGIAYALGPNINASMRAAARPRAFAAAKRAQELAAGCAPAEKALIAAIAARYAEAPPADRAPLDRAYADAMRDAFRQHPDDPDVGALFAEALLDLAPWDQWNADGTPRPGTEEVLAALEHVLARSPEHPQALHLYIHATEASTAPARALTAAQRLPQVAPGLGHLVHMPAHTFQRVGRYREALAANLAGAAVDERYFAASGPQRGYHGYHGHNLHFAVYSAMFLGDRAAALAAAQRLVQSVPAHIRSSPSTWFDSWMTMPQMVHLRFGDWRAVLAEPAPEARLPIATALDRYARALALVNLDDRDAAVAMQQEFATAAAAVPESAHFGLTPAAPVLEVARGMLAGELAFRQGDRDGAFAALRQAVAAEDALRYDEPPGWMMPVRHALGALLLEDARYDEAEQVYRQDLARHPENGWSLHGLAECLRHGDPAAAAAVEARFRAAWRDADVTLPGSCFCRRAP